jgi:hypothetical protein
MQARKADVLAALEKSGSAKMQELEGEADALVASWDSVCSVAAGVRFACATLRPAQLAALFPTLDARIGSVLTTAGALPQGRLRRPRAIVDVSQLSGLTSLIAEAGRIEIEVPRQTAHAQVGVHGGGGGVRALAENAGRIGFSYTMASTCSLEQCAQASLLLHSRITCLTPALSRGPSPRCAVLLTAVPGMDPSLTKAASPP